MDQRTSDAKLKQSTAVTDDDPCWGSPSKCSLADLLQIIGEKSTAILYQSDDYLVLNKPPDLRMDGPYQATVHKLLTYWYPPPSLRHASDVKNSPDTDLLKRISVLHQHNHVADNELRPCHQLDYATSGVLLVARTKEAADAARQSFEFRNAKKSYLAVLHGHLTVKNNKVTPNDTKEEIEQWPVLSRAVVDERLQYIEEMYRQQRRKRRKDTWAGYQPPHALFQQWQQYQRRKQRRNSKLSHLTKRSTTSSFNNNKHLTDQQWEQVWNELQLEEQPEQQLDNIDGGKIKQTVQSNMNWKQVKAANQTKPFARAAEVYNRIMRENEARQHSTKGHSSGTGLPVFFRIEEDDPDTFCIFTSLAQTDKDFSMRLHPNLLSSSTSTLKVLPKPLQIGEDDMDYKPSLTVCTVLERTMLAPHKIPITKVRLEPRTGRRHQLRVHMALANHAIVGDQTYQPPSFSEEDAGNQNRRQCNPFSKRMCLHSSSLEIPVLGEHVLKVISQDPFIQKNENAINQQ